MGTPKVLVLDLENTVCRTNDKNLLDPYDSRNELVMIGYWWVGESEDNVQVAVFNHDERQGTIKDYIRVQSALNEADLVVFHGAQHDLKWLKAVGLEVRSPVWCTMIAEYTLQRGVKKPLSLDAVASLRKCRNHKLDTLKGYLDAGVSVRSIPLNKLTEYQIADVLTTGEIYVQQAHEYIQPSNVGLLPTLRRANQTCLVLVDMCHVGFAVDEEALKEVEQEFLQEKAAIEKELDTQIAHFMGDAVVNLNSPAQMSAVIYSRVPQDKTIWADLFDRQTGKDFTATIKRNTHYVYKKRAERCKECRGTGKVWRKKKDGTPFKKPNNCKNCDGVGVVFIDQPQIAGLKFNPKGVSWVKSDGFATGKEELKELADTALALGKEREHQFLLNLIRLNAISSYLSNFVDAIGTFCREDGLLHVILTQTVTATARFSGREPNMQNMPRGGTFPVKKVFVSRWKGGKILDADFAQLEFRGAAFLSGDSLAKQEIEEGFDVHSFTAKTITESGLPTSRQAAKPHTFAPLYGATAYGKLPAIGAYYTAFVAKYEGIADWHQRLATEALTFGKITLPTGREYDFSHATRRRNGQPTYFTQIKNYPVQGFATADVVPMVLCVLHYEMQYLQLKSLIVNSVHDSIIVDVHPEEVEIMCALVKKISDNMHFLMLKYLAIDMDVPLLIDAKIGDNWLDTQDVDEYNFAPLNLLYEERNDRSERSCFERQHELRDDGCGYGCHASDWQARFAAPREDQQSVDYCPAEYQG